MSVGLVALLDDIATLAKAAAASLDDVAGAAAKASAKAAGVVVDDAAVTPRYVVGLDPSRELPIIWKIARGSIINKLLIILPLALLLSQFLPQALQPILMLGGAFLCFEGAEKVIGMFGGHADEGAASTEAKPANEKQITSGAIRTDLILSAEIMVIALNEVADQPFWNRLSILIVVGILLTAGVYGAVAILVKLDDIGLKLAESKRPARSKFGIGLVNVMPAVFNTISVIGTVAMLWVGGHLFLVGLQSLGLGAPYEFVHHLEGFGAAVPGVGGVLGWLINTTCSLIFGLILGSAIVGIIHVLPFGKSHEQDEGNGKQEHRAAPSGETEPGDATGNGSSAVRADR